MRISEQSARPTAWYVILVLWYLLVGGVMTATAELSGTNDAPKQVAVRRDPFWPIGYVPEYVTQEEIDPVAAQAPSDSGWDAARREVDINGVSSRSDNQFCAVINGQLMEVGDTLSVNYKGIIYTWEVEDIAASGSVKLRRVSAGTNQ
ncbi:MAG TPA: hypothetical protein VIR63_00310 [Pontiella sp.]